MHYNKNKGFDRMNRINRIGKDGGKHGAPGTH
jgi:hypothetical protein